MRPFSVNIKWDSGLHAARLQYLLIVVSASLVSNRLLTETYSGCFEPHNRYACLISGLRYEVFTSASLIVHILLNYLRGLIEGYEKR